MFTNWNSPEGLDAVEMSVVPNTLEAEAQLDERRFEHTHMGTAVCKIVMQKSKTFRTSWAEALKVCPDDESRKRQREAAKMVR